MGITTNPRWSKLMGYCSQMLFESVKTKDPEEKANLDFAYTKCTEELASAQNESIRVCGADDACENDYMEHRMSAYMRMCDRGNLRRCYGAMFRENEWGMSCMDRGSLVDDLYTELQKRVVSGQNVIDDHWSIVGENYSPFGNYEDAEGNIVLQYTSDKEEGYVIEVAKGVPIWRREGDNAHWIGHVDDRNSGVYRVSVRRENGEELYHASDDGCGEAFGCNYWIAEITDSNRLGKSILQAGLDLLSAGTIPVGDYRIGGSP